MKAAEDRRSPHVRRVSLVALVDICQATGEGSPFQGHSANVSGRGMHVRTGYLPELGEELVCRFEHDQQEILVEGRVAWRSESEDGGEFGIQFTALDAECADVLKGLGSNLSLRPPGLDPAASVDEEKGDESSSRLELAQGQRVRLHMDGLGAPMKASVHSGGDRRIRVGSGLEFLKVGRSLEVEEIEGGGRQTARVDSVNVVINPQTSVPELVVQLRYEGISDTPPPAQVDGQDSSDPEHAPGDEDELDGDGPWESVDALSEKLGGLMDRVSVVAQVAGDRMGHALSMVSSRAGGGVKRRRKRPKAVPEEVSAEPLRTKRRVQRTRRPTGRAPSHLRSGIHDLNMTGQVKPASRRMAAREVPTAGRRSTRARILTVMGLLVVALGSAAALRGFGRGQEPATKADGNQADSARVAAKKPTAHEAPPPAAPQQPSPPQSPEGIVADVPLFGKRAVVAEAPETGEEKVDVEAAEKLAAAAAVPDQTWEGAKLSAEKQAEAQPWGRGRLHLPTIHRIRLDGAGTQLSGAVEPNGFVVVVPGRKAMESGRSIQKRDKRIASVTASNTEDGAKMRFQFRGPVPPYRVRLRKDFVEFLISAPEEGVAAL